MKRPGIRSFLAGAVGLVGVVAFVHRTRQATGGRDVPGGIVMGDVGGYDRASRLFFRSLFRGVATDLVAAVRPPARVLEVGCGPGLLSIELARRGFAVTGMDLDPAMIERARSNAGAAGEKAPIAETPTGPTFIVADVAHLPFDDASFDLVTSTFSMHHWADRVAGLAEIARVIRPGGRAVIWDIRPGAIPFHGLRGLAHGFGVHGAGGHGAAESDAHGAGEDGAASGHGVAGHDAAGHDAAGHDAAGHDDGAIESPLGRPTVTAWRWPLWLTVANRFEFVRPEVPDPVVGAASLG